MSSLITAIPPLSIAKPGPATIGEGTGVRESVVGTKVVGEELGSKDGEDEGSSLVGDNDGASVEPDGLAVSILGTDVDFEGAGVLGVGAGSGPPIAEGGEDGEDVGVVVGTAVCVVGADAVGPGIGPPTLERLGADVLARVEVVVGAFEGASVAGKSVGEPDGSRLGCPVGLSVSDGLVGISVG